MTQKDDSTMQYTFRIPKELKRQMEIISVEEDRTLSKQIIHGLRCYLKDRAVKND
jgi:hypothetical protein